MGMIGRFHGRGSYQGERERSAKTFIRPTVILPGPNEESLPGPNEESATKRRKTSAHGGAFVPNQRGQS
jgi:hypothetical protein